MRARRALVVASLALVLGLGWWWCDEPEPVALQPVALAPPVSPSVEPTSAHEAEPVVDAGAIAEAVPDAGAPVVAAVPVPEPDIADYMRRWREALAPLFRPATGPQRTVLLRTLAAGAPDAGVQPCKPKVQLLALRPRRADVVVVVDTSGSMSRALPRISRWLGELELAISEGSADVQLLVLAEQRALGRKQSQDGGYNMRVGSTDALEVLLAGARAGMGRWTDALRPGVDLRIVVVTDDEAGGDGPTFVSRLSELLGDTRFSVNLLGGLETFGAVLAPDAPLVESTCRAEGVTGLDRGLAYQQAVRLTGGARASLCSEVARSRLSDALLHFDTLPAQCAWLLDVSGYRVDRIEAVGPRRPPTRLVPEPHVSACPGARQSYQLVGSMLALCADTCTSLRDNRFDGIRLALECVE